MSLDLNTFWTLKPTQEKFMKVISECKINEMKSVAYVGAVGSGKSWVLCRAAIGLALTYPGMRILLGRHLSTDLRDSTEKTFFELITELEDKIKLHYPPEVRSSVPPVGEFHKANRDFEFSNGSLIMFRPLDEADKKYKSLNVAAVGIDEADQVTKASVEMLMARRRQMGYPLLLFLVSNPSGYTHWLYEWFVKNKQPNYYLFQTNSYENKDNLPPGYIEEMLRKFSPEKVRRYVEGEWGGISEGLAIYGGLFDAKIHVKEALVTRGLPIWIGVDFGYNSPGVIWAQPDRLGRCRIIREWGPHELDTYALCQGILKRNQVWFPNSDFLYFCGHDGNQNSPNADKTGIEIMNAHGMNPSWRVHHLESAFTVIRNMLKTREDGTPNLTIDPSCAITCEAFMGEYKYKPVAKEGVGLTEKPHKNDIHDPLMDAFRYIAYQNYSLSGDFGLATSRIRLFGKTVKDDDDPDDAESSFPVPQSRHARRAYAQNGWSRR